MIGITATKAELDELLEGGTPMEFKKGDLVECWDHDVEKRENCEYFAFNDCPKACFPHLAYRFQEDGTRYPDIFKFKHCRPARPDLKIDDPVWAKVASGWLPKHFAGWNEDGFMKYWEGGKTSHTTRGAFIVAMGYRLTPPDSE